MKTLTIALKDLTRSFRSMFLLAFMFAVPLMMAGVFYLMFGNTAQTASGSGAAPAAVKVIVANLDRGDPALAEGLAVFPGGAGMQSLGQMITQTLQNPSLNGLLQVSLSPDAASARQAVESKQADAAVIIPAQFSASYVGAEGGAAIQLYQDPASIQASAVLKAVLGQALDGLSGARIAINVALASGGSGNTDPAVVGEVVQSYTASVAATDPAAALLDVTSAAKSAPPAAANPMGQMLAPIMGGMLILFAFFTGGASCESILREDEAGTLARIFTTPTRRSSILGGKLLAVGLTVLVQVALLLVAASLIFGIRWGDLLPVALSALGIIACAAAFGIFITSLLKSTRQGGVVYGGLITITGMLGMMTVFTGGGQGGVVSTMSLLVPQGWAVRGLTLAYQGAALGDVALNLLVLLGLSLAFFAIGVLRFQKRYA